MQLREVTEEAPGYLEKKSFFCLSQDSKWHPGSLEAAAPTTEAKRDISLSLAKLAGLYIILGHYS